MRTSSGQRPRPDPRRDRGTRLEMGETVEAIGYKADVKSRVKESLVEKKDAAISKVTGAMPETDGASRSEEDGRVAKENPLGRRGRRGRFLVCCCRHPWRTSGSGSRRPGSRERQGLRTGSPGTGQARRAGSRRLSRSNSEGQRPRTGRGQASSPRETAWRSLTTTSRLRGLGSAWPHAGPLCAAPRVLTRKAGCLRSRRTCVSQQVDEGEHAGRRRDRRSRFPGWIECCGVRSRCRRPTRTSVMIRPPTGPSRSALYGGSCHSQDVEPEWRFAAPSRIAAEAERRVGKDVHAHCLRDLLVDEADALPRSVLRTARWVVGSGGGTTDPGRSVSGNESFVSILRGLRAAKVGSTGRMFFHSTTRSEGIGRWSAVEALIRAEDRDAAAVQRRLVDHVERANDAVAEPIGRDGELDRHERPSVPIRRLVVGQADDRRLAGDLLGTRRHRPGRGHRRRIRRCRITAHW